MGGVNLAHFLRLERPLTVVDLETTGFDPDKDRIIQISLTVHYPTREPIPYSTLINPGRPITNSAESHKITDDMVQGYPTWEELGPMLAPKMINIDIMGYNVDFDIKFLRGQMKRIGVNWPWAGHVVDAFEILKKVSPRTLANAYREYGGENGEPLPRDTKLEGAHNAAIDVAATELVLRGQLLRHTHLPRTVKELQDFCFPDKGDWIDSKGKFKFVDGVPCITFGKYVKNTGGKPVPMKAVELNYWKFILGSDFEPEMKEIAAAALMGTYPIKQKE
jgi:DNA polymerase-3 subunit epsilon